MGSDFNFPKLICNPLQESGTDGIQTVHLKRSGWQSTF